MSKISNNIFVLLITCTVVTIVLLFVNLYIFLNKNEGYVYNMSNYVSIYYPSEFPSIDRIQGTENDSVEIILSQIENENNWIISIDSNSYQLSSKFPKIYVPFNTDNKVFIYEILNQHTGFRFTIILQRQVTGSILVIKSSIPYTQVNRYNFNDFCDISWIEQSEKDAVLKILKDSINIDTCTTTMSKINEICKHISRVTRGRGGTDLKYWWNEYTAFQLYEKSSRGETTLTCNEYLQIYYLFANMAGIRTRRVGLVGYGDSDGTVKLSGHHFNESYVEELNKYIFVDLSFEKAYVVNAAGIPLNTYELYMANVSDNILSLYAAVPVDDSIKIIPYSQVNKPESDYFNENCIIQYKFGNDRFKVANQVIRYLFNPEPVLCLNYTNDRLFFKNIMQYFLIISVIILLIFIWIFVKRKFSIAKSKNLTKS